MTQERKLLLYFIASLTGAILVVARVFVIIKGERTGDNFNVFMDILALVVCTGYTITFAIRFIKLKNALPKKSNPHK